MTTLYTLGHSKHSLEKFLSLLRGQGAYPSILTLVDVRSNPHSRFNPHFNQKALAAELANQGIHYIFAGQALGGRPKDPLCYRPAGPGETAPVVDYGLVMQRAWFLQGIDELLAAARQSPTAVLCSEADPANCHRHHLIARYLFQAHPEIDVQHILASGQLLSARKLVDDSGKQLGLF